MQAALSGVAPASPFAQHTAMIDASTPFVLLDDASGGEATARLFVRPQRIAVARTAGEVRDMARFVDAARADGLPVAGFLAYEAGYALEPKLSRLARDVAADATPLAWFAAFAEVRLIPADQIPALLPDPAGAWVGTPQPAIERKDYDRAIAAVKAYIAAGDIYQANLTFQSQVAVCGDPLALYARLRAAAAGWGGVVYTGDHWLLSASPELFYTRAEGRLTARPMKGTAARRADPAEDAAAARQLTESPKERAENLMIVDLLRNDFARISAAGSVAVPRLFDVETYPTVHQMTSTVTAAVADPALPPFGVVEALFPCGSVTGAPKIRAMEVIAEVEAGPRGAYTGSIGGWTDAGESFNVAIRTLVMKAGDKHACLGLGSGIVADSTADAEWRECLAKGAFVTAGAARFDLFTTMLYDPLTGIADLDLHMKRMAQSATALGFPFDRHGVCNELQAATFRLRSPCRLRLRLSRSGAVAIEVRALPAPVAAPVAVVLAPLPVSAGDFRLRHKTSDRSFYDAARIAGGAFETVFVDPHGFVTEGSFTNLFVERGGTLLTPPLSRGLLPGVLRARLIDEGEAVEANLRPADLAGGFLVGNALRGLIPARLVAGSDRPGL
jgi:para-aminobenzoate synthetase/4-amino-4-deoxychorismate lyase